MILPIGFETWVWYVKPVKSFGMKVMLLIHLRMSFQLENSSLFPYELQLKKCQFTVSIYEHQWLLECCISDSQFCKFCSFHNQWVLKHKTSSAFRVHLYLVELPSFIVVFHCIFMCESCGCVNRITRSARCYDSE
jgi:hypothetical protein